MPKFMEYFLHCEKIDAMNEINVIKKMQSKQSRIIDMLARWDNWN